MSELEIRAFEESDLDEALELLNRTFSETFDADWFLWKHRHGPFGPSPGWIARDASGLVGVRWLLRWRLVTSSGRVARAVRPVDTATAARARRRGVFRALNETAWRWATSRDDIDLFWNTPNEASAPAYEALGWSLLPLRRAVSWVGGGAGAQVLADEEAWSWVADAAPAGGCWSTSRTAEYLDWRYRSCPGSAQGLGYEAVRLASAEEPAALVYRPAIARGRRVLVVTEAAGTRRTLSVLSRAAARRTGASWVLFASGEGAPAPPLRWAVRRGGCTLAVRAVRPLDPDPMLRSSWALTLGDLERIL